MDRVFESQWKLCFFLVSHRMNPFSSENCSLPFTVVCHLGCFCFYAFWSFWGALSLPHPLVPNGGRFLRTQPWKNTFPVECSDKNRTIHRVPQIVEKSWKNKLFQNSSNFSNFPLVWLCNTMKIEEILSWRQIQQNLGQSSRSSVETQN